MGINPVESSKFIQTIEMDLGMKAEKEFLEMQAGDVPANFADIDDRMHAEGLKPSMLLTEGIRKFVQGYKDYFNS